MDPLQCISILNHSPDSLSFLWINGNLTNITFNVTKNVIFFFTFTFLSKVLEQLNLKGDHFPYVKVVSIIRN